MQGARVDDQRRASPVLFGPMRMAVKEEIEVRAVLDVPQKRLVIPMRPGQLDAVEFQIAEMIV